MNIQKDYTIFYLFGTKKIDWKFYQALLNGSLGLNDLRKGNWIIFYWLYFPIIKYNPSFGRPIRYGRKSFQLEGHVLNLKIKLIRESIW